MDDRDIAQQAALKPAICVWCARYCGQLDPCGLLIFDRSITDGGDVYNISPTQLHYCRDYVRREGSP